jgi:hypothetical protein
MLKSSRWSTAFTSSGLNPQSSPALGNAALVSGRSAELAAMTN